MAAVTRIYTDAGKSVYGRDRKTWADFGLPRIRELLDISPDTPREIFAGAIPFSIYDTTAGAENELQTVVIGSEKNADFPLYIQNSNYYKNLLKRASIGESTRKPLLELHDFLNNNPNQVWENSWVRFPESCLSSYARQILTSDLRADKTIPNSPERSDCRKYFFISNNLKYIRVPVSYLLRLFLSDAVSPETGIHPILKSLGEKLPGHFLNDNTSPEIFSFYPVSLKPGTQMGRGIAKETLKRFLLSQLLLIYADRKFKLSESGQKPMIYFAPHPPFRQKQLNSMISDSFYRELFMSPCLYGWDSLGKTKTQWLNKFRNGDYAVFRLTPDKYHYNHMPVSGKVVDIYEIPGIYSPCNPGAVMTLCSPYSKNKRVVIIIDVHFFLNKAYTSAFIIPLMTTQRWRCVSEFFRADYRGEGKISAYQIMGILSVIYGIVLALLFPVSGPVQSDALSGIKYLWNLAMILFLQALWVTIFLYTGRSKVTAFVSYHVIQDNV